MGLGAPDGSPGASQAALEAFASFPTNPNKSLNASEKELKTVPVCTSNFEQNLGSPSHLRITINSEDQKIEIEQVKVTLVYKGHGGLDNMESITEESSFTYGLTSRVDERNTSHSHLQVTEFNISGNVRKEDGVEKLPDNNENVVDAGKAWDERYIEENGDRTDIEEKEKQNEDAQMPMKELEKLTIDENENVDLGEISSLDGIILPPEEDEELFRAPALLLVFDYRSNEWRVREFGEIVILCRSERNYQLQFRRYQQDGYVTSLALVLRKSFKLHQMRSYRDQAWEWTVHYVTEGGSGAFQTLGAKFLNRSVASEFYERIKDCVTLLKNGDVLDANSEEGFLAPSQSIRLMSRTSTPTFGPGTLQARSADTYERSSGRLSAQCWTSPITSKSRKIVRTAIYTERGYYQEYQYKDKTTRYSVNSPVENNIEESKVSLVYKCHTCGLCFDRPEILLNKHLNKCSPNTKIVKTKCTCGLTFDQYNFKYHCEVHRKYTGLYVKRVVVREEKNLDVSGMKEVFMENVMGVDEAGEVLKENCSGTDERSAKNDDNNAVADTEQDNLNEVEIVKKVATGSVVRTKAHPVYVCQCRLCFDRAEFFIKHLSKCHLDANLVKTTCVCDLVYDKYNFAYHCEVHRQVTMLNVKYIIVRDEGYVDISGMIQEFEEYEEIKVTESMKIELEKTVDQNMVDNDNTKHIAEQNDDKIISAATENNDVESEDKAIYTTNQETEKEIIESEQNKTDDSEAVLHNASKEVNISTESNNAQNSEIPNNSTLYGKVTTSYDPDLDQLHIQQTVDNTTLTDEEKQDCDIAIDAVKSDKKNDAAEETLIKDENRVEENIVDENLTEKTKTHDQTNTKYHGLEREEIEVVNSNINDIPTKDANGNKDIKEVIEKNKTVENQEAINLRTKEIHVTVEANSEEIDDRVYNENDQDLVELMTDEPIEEQHDGYVDNEPIDSDKTTSKNIVKQMLAKDDRYEKNIVEENKMEEKHVDHQIETVADEKLNAGSEINEMLNSTQNTLHVKDAIQIPGDDKHETGKRQKGSEENEPLNSTQNTEHFKNIIKIPGKGKIEDNNKARKTETGKREKRSEEIELIHSTQNTQHLKDIIKNPGDDKNEDNKKSRENETSEKQKTSEQNEPMNCTQNTIFSQDIIHIINEDNNEIQENATREINVFVEICNVEYEVPDKLESKVETNTSDSKNNQKDPNLLKSMIMINKKANDNVPKEKQRKISEPVAIVADKKSADGNVKNDKKENQASTATNSNQGKTRKQWFRNTNDNKRSTRGRKK